MTLKATEETAGLDGPQISACFEKENGIEQIYERLQEFPVIYGLKTLNLPYLILPSKPNLVKQSFSSLYEMCNTAESLHDSQIFNIVGELYAKVMSLDQRKGTASYYTRPEVAEYLAELSFLNGIASCDRIDDFRAADFACGTGTLMRASYIHAKNYFDAHSNLQNFHKHMIQNGICATDISPVSPYLATTSLLRLAPGIALSQCMILQLPFGAIKNDDPSQVAVGGLEVGMERTPTLFSHTFEEAVNDLNCRVTFIKPYDQDFDLVLMNPPYSRPKAGHGLFSIEGIDEDVRNSMKERARKQITGTVGGSLMAGLGSVFACISVRKLKTGGRLGLVLPNSLAILPTWEETRDLLTSECVDLTATYFSLGTGGDASSMSADTMIGEVVITGKKGTQGREGIVYVSLDQPFSNISKASEAATAVNDALSQAVTQRHGNITDANGIKIGEWLWDKTPGNQWKGVGVTGLNGFYDLATEVAHGKIGSIQVPMCLLSEIFTLGPSGHQIGYAPDDLEQTEEYQVTGPFSTHKITDDGTEDYPKLLWHSDSAEQNRIIVQPTHYGIPHPTLEELVDPLLEKASDLFLQVNMRWSSNKILVAMSDQPLLGSSSWIGLDTDNETLKLAASIWGEQRFWVCCVLDSIW